MSEIIRPKVGRPPKRYGKGSKRRPESLNKFQKNWDFIRWPKRRLK